MKTLIISLFAILFFAGSAKPQDSTFISYGNVFWVPLQPGEMVNLGLEWQKETRKSKTFSISYMRHSGIKGGFFGPNLVPTRGFALRYSQRYFFKNATVLKGSYHGPMLQARVFTFSDRNEPAGSPSGLDQKDVKVLSLQYLIGKQHVFGSGITFGVFAGIGVRLKHVSNDAYFEEYNKTNIYGSKIKKIESNSLLLWAPSAHLNFSVGYAFK